MPWVFGLNALNSSQIIFEALALVNACSISISSLQEIDVDLYEQYRSFHAYKKKIGEPRMDD